MDNERNSTSPSTSIDNILSILDSGKKLQELSAEIRNSADNMSAEASSVTFKVSSILDLDDLDVEKLRPE